MATPWFGDVVKKTGTVVTAVSWGLVGFLLLCMKMAKNSRTFDLASLFATMMVYANASEVFQGYRWLAVANANGLHLKKYFLASFCITLALEQFTSLLPAIVMVGLISVCLGIRYIPFVYVGLNVDWPRGVTSHVLVLIVQFLGFIWGSKAQYLIFFSKISSSVVSLFVSKPLAGVGLLLLPVAGYCLGSAMFSYVPKSKLPWFRSSLMTAIFYTLATLMCLWVQSSVPPTHADIPLVVLNLAAAGFCIGARSRTSPVDFLCAFARGEDVSPIRLASIPIGVIAGVFLWRLQQLPLPTASYDPEYMAEFAMAALCGYCIGSKTSKTRLLTGMVFLLSSVTVGGMSFLSIGLQTAATSGWQSALGQVAYLVFIQILGVYYGSQLVGPFAPHESSRERDSSSLEQ